MQQAKVSGFSVSAIAIRQHIGTLMLTVAVIVMGIYFMTTIQVDLLPAITYPRIGVRLEAPGISPEVAVDEITRPLEEALSATENVVQVFSRTREGQVSLDLFFEPGGDIDQALNDATAAFNRGRGQLPETIEEPRLFKVDPSQLPIYELALTSTSLQGKDLRVFADEELSRELSVIPGVAAVDVSGAAEEEVRVLVDLKRLQALNIGLTDVLNELTERNQDTSGGRILGQNSEPLTRTVGRFKDAKEIENLSIEVSSPTSTTPPHRVYLRDFAEVIDGTEDQRVSVYLNRQPAVKLSVQKQPDANTITVVEGVKQRIKQLQQSGLIPADMVLTATTDESRFIRNSLNDVIFNAISGALLAAAAVLLFLGSLRQTFIISLAIPLCSLAAIAMMKFFGLSLNVFSLAGLTLGIGQAIDTSVVILENISEKAGKTPNQREGGRGRGGEGEKQRMIENAIAEVNQVLKSIKLPEGVSIVPSSAQETNQQLQDALKTLGALAVFLIFVVMAVQYNSLLDPLVIMFTVPLALAGGIFGLYITKTAIGATVIVGVVLLVGIVVNAGILMVESANQIREEENCTREIAILKAAPQRLRPIMMTTVTTILGLFPLALGIGEGSEFLQPLGIVVFFGMAIATLMTLFIIPCLYILLHEFQPGKWAKPVLMRLRYLRKNLKRWN
ncbi:acriflavin resistance protein [Tolypothrix sp. NIES-4075]|uniref:efflux RND transporter permease subunit n=1 Tax=Tolypothrix sp. NIES-4075 TaxID=2005459 RepID=UPI000B5C87F9|nr:efflux RND transporter permease subunit [Tolypothrix sp. NIES-4075]GAX42503.1 acriflavin resistance protein [Tolypothrix sp. NIES-4075]